MCDKGRIIGIADYYSGDAFCATIGMECVGWNGISAEVQAGRGTAMRALVEQYISLQHLASDRVLFVLRQSC